MRTEADSTLVVKLSFNRQSERSRAEFYFPKIKVLVTTVPSEIKKPWHT